MWAKKKFVVKIDEIYVDQKKHQMVTYMDANTESIRQKNSLTKHKKKIVGR